MESSVFLHNSMVDPYEGRIIYARFEIVSQDYVKNKSTVAWSLISEGGEKESYYVDDTLLSVTWFNGQYHTLTLFQLDSANMTSQTFPRVVGSVGGTFEVEHAYDGNLPMNIGLKTKIGSSHISQDGIGSGGTLTWHLTPIKKDVRITSAPNFNDEENPTITYINEPAEKTTTLTLQLMSEDGAQIFATRIIPNTGTSYKMELTTAERNAIRNFAKNTTSLPVKFKLTSYIAQSAILSGATFTHTETKYCSIVNANPTISATVTKISDDAGSLTGSADVLILRYSDVRYAMTPKALKGASIVATKVTCGSQSSATHSGTFEDVDDGNFIFYAIDSRGNSTTVTIGRQYVDYTRLTCNLEIDAPRTDGSLDFDIVGNYSPENFGEINNILTVQYRYKVNEGEYGNWITVTPTIGSNYYSAHVSLEGLNYQYMYRFQARAVDRLLLAESGHVPIKTRPVFDWSENDFNFNCPVTITDGYLKYPLMGIINAMTKTYPCSVTTFDGENYTVTNAGATICGNVLRCNFTASRNSATGSGNIANETVCTISIAHGGKISGMLNTCFGNGANGHVASFLTSNVSQTYETLDFNVQVSATGGATNEFSTYFQIPITINLDKFVEE